MELSDPTSLPTWLMLLVLARWLFADGFSFVKWRAEKRRLSARDEADARRETVDEVRERSEFEYLKQQLDGIQVELRNIAVLLASMKRG